MSAFASLLLCLAAGCTTTGGGNWFSKRPDPLTKAVAPNIDVAHARRGMILEPMDAKSRQELDAAQRLFQEKKYADAEKLYHQIAMGDDKQWWDVTGVFESETTSSKRKKMPKSVLEEALFYEAECQRFQKNYRDAELTYTKLLSTIAYSQYTKRVCEGLYEIADHWLTPTKRQMAEYHEQLQGKRSFVMPASLMYFSNDMPALDAEGHAVNILNTIRLHDINGPMGEKALFSVGTIHFFRADYREADYYFNELYHKYPNSDKAAQAVKQSIICKQLMTGGSVYDLRTVEEAKKLLMTAQSAYPEFGKGDNPKWIENQLQSMTFQQADRDFKIAEFYQRTGHPGPAYFCFELVCRRYPGTKHAADAAKRKDELKGKVDREKHDQETPLPPQQIPVMGPQFQPGVIQRPINQPGPLPSGVQ